METDCAIMGYLKKKYVYKRRFVDGIIYVCYQR